MKTLVKRLFSIAAVALSSVGLHAEPLKIAYSDWP